MIPDSIYEDLTPGQQEVLAPYLLDNGDRRLLRRALIALCCEYEGEARTPAFCATVRAVAKKLGALDGLLEAMTQTQKGR